MKLLVKENIKFTLFIEKILVVFFSVAIIFITLHSVYDPDVFWHLKTGEWIWQHKRLPDKDPFSFTVDPSIYVESKRPYSILRKYWLSQLTIYGFYSFLGICGIILFRCLIYFGLIFLLYFWMRKRGIKQIITLLFLIPSLVVLLSFRGERPNTFSYLMAVIVFYILDEYIYTGKRKGLLLPVFMLIWSAMHGGFLLGEVLIGAYLIVMIYRLLKREFSFKVNSFKMTTLLISMILPFLAKSNWNTVMMTLEKSGYLKAYVAEYANPFFHARLGNYSDLVLVILMISLIILIIKNLSLEHVLNCNLSNSYIFYCRKVYSISCISNDSHSFFTLDKTTYL